MTSAEALASVYGGVFDELEESSLYPTGTLVDFESNAIAVTFKAETIGGMDGQRICIDAMWSVLHGLCVEQGITPKGIVSDYEVGSITLYL